MPRGGKRPNAGRKLAPETVEFRAFWRAWFDSKEGRAYLLRRAKASDTILAKLIDKVWPSPQAVKLESEGKRTIIVTAGGLDLSYAPKMPIVIEGK